MRRGKFNKIVVKFLSKEANHDELEKLDVDLKNNKNAILFNNYVRVDYLTSLYMSTDNLDNAKRSIRKKVRKADSRRRLKLYGKVAIAASIILFIGLSLFQEDATKQTEAITTGVEIGSSKAILTLENGNEVSLKKGNSFEKENVTSNGEHLIYKNQVKEDISKNKIVYNYLSVPRGGEFFLQLSDGSKVWLNSESKLKYPVAFKAGMPREIELLYGEAYLEVSSSTNHNGALFKVLTVEQQITVMGTEFNVKAYKGEDKIYTTLAGGRIEVSKGSIIEVLSPHEQSIIELGSDNITISQVDVSKEIAWVKGLFNFENQSLDEIMETLSRWYDVKVFFETSKRKNFTFTGILQRTKSIEDILRLIETTSSGEVNFETKDGTVIVK